jgi:hypothetical protein
MSWGERSCQKPCREPESCSYETCNVDCRGYHWDGVTKPDSRSARRKGDVDGQFTSTNIPMAAQSLNRAQRRAANRSARLRHR